MKRNTPSIFAVVSVGASLATIILKLFAFFLTNSVGLLSDALESLVNLMAAVITFFMLRLAQKPPDSDHHYGHSKAEYIASVAEGIFILVAAGAIIFSAIQRIIHPVILETPGIGLLFSVAATGINAYVGLLLIRKGRKHQSLALEADGHHLLTDVWTTIGVLAGLAIVYTTKLYILDPIIAIIAGINIIFTGLSIVQRSLAGFMDTAIDTISIQTIHKLLDPYKEQGLAFHVLRTRQSGRRKFVSFHLLVPGSWSVQQAHEMVEEIEKKIRAEVSFVTIDIHIEPIEDPRAWNDGGLDRDETATH